MQRRPAEEVVGLETAAARGSRLRRSGTGKGAASRRFGSVRANSWAPRKNGPAMRPAFTSMRPRLSSRATASDLESLRRLAQRTVSRSWVTMDKQGGLWLSPRDGRSHPKVGLSANTLCRTRRTRGRDICWRCREWMLSCARTEESGDAWVLPEGLGVDGAVAWAGGSGSGGSAAYPERRGTIGLSRRAPLLLCPRHRQPVA